MNRLVIFTPGPPNGTPTQGVLIGELLASDGVDVRVVSRASTSIGRFFDIALRGLFEVAGTDSVLTNVYGGRAFVHESLAILYARLLRKRSVAVIRGGWLLDFVKRHPYWGKFILSLPDLNVTPHQFLFQGFGNMGIGVGRVIPNFIQLENYPFRMRDRAGPRFLYTRGTHEIYNPEMAVRAFGAIREKVTDATLTMAGTGDQTKVKELVRSLGLSSIVRFVGLVPKREIPELIDHHDIYIQSNRVENMPVSILEMWACGIPVVATEVGGTSHLVNSGNDGLLVASENPEALAEACLRLLKEPQLVERLSSNGRQRVEEFSWENVQSSWLDALFPNDKK